MSNTQKREKDEAEAPSSSSTSSKGLQTITLKLDSAKANKTFERYGHIVTPILAKNLSPAAAEVDQTVDAGFKVWTTNGEYQTILPIGTVFFPHEEVHMHLNHILSEKRILQELKLEEKEVKVDSYDRRYGFIKYWKFMTGRKYEIKNSAQKGDVVGWGVVVRNGIGTGTALGADIYTDRVVCGNGSVARGKDFGFALKHVGNFKQMAEDFENGLRVVFQKAEELMQLYEDMCEVRATQKSIEKLYDSTGIADKVWEKIPFIAIDEKAKQTHDRIKLHEKAKQQVSLFDVFNSLTNPLTRNFETTHSFSRLYDNTVSLHRQMDIIVHESKGVGRRLV